MRSARAHAMAAPPATNGASGSARAAAGAAVAQDESSAECGCENEAENERLGRDAAEARDDQQGELDVAHPERGGPEQTENEHEHDESESAEEFHVDAIQKRSAA